MKINTTLKSICFILLFAFCFSSVYAQKGKNKEKDTKSTKESSKTGSKSNPNAINPESFSQEQLELMILTKINAARKAKGMDTLKYNDILTKAARDQAEYMASKEEVTLEGAGKRKTTGKRISFYGGSESGEEMVVNQPVNKGKDFFTYDDVASIITDKWIKGKVQSIIIYNNTYIYGGVGAVLEPATKKVYVSMVYGSFNTFNIGPEKRNELPVPYTKKKFRLKPYEDKECKACAKFADIEKLQKGLVVKDNKIYFTYPNVKVLSKLLKNKRDGLAVDIIQREQYPCAPYNIYDTRLLSKGVMLKRKWSKRIFKKNLIKDKKSKALEVYLGDLPKNLKGDYELNLMVIQNRRICRVLTRKYVEDGGLPSLTPLDLIPDTVPKDALKYKPVAETKTLTFNIPFDKNKSSYSTEDIIPFIESLNEPEFTIEQILISAYSSIEGDSVLNANLQRKRAESIMTAIVKLQKKEFVKDIITADGWELFKKQVAGTKYAPMAMMNKSDVKKAINGGLWKEMEDNILAKQRFAEIKLTVTYDITGDKEQFFVSRVFKKAIEKKDTTLALNVQQYMISKVLEEKYKADPVIALDIPKEGPFASLLVNRIWLRKHVAKDTISQEIADLMFQLSKMAPKNRFASYNSLVCHVKLSPVGKERTLDSVQTRINDLYSTALPKDRIDALNLEHQFKVIDALEPVEGAKPIVQKSIDRIRGIYRIEGSSWQNALKLAYIFIGNNDYEFALKIIEPFVDKPEVDENLIFTYASLCTHFQDKLSSSKFIASMKKAREMNPKRFCKLFGAPYMSFQVMDNPFLKEEFCKYCESKSTTVESSPSGEGKKAKANK